MQINGYNRFLVIDRQADSLYSLIADGEFRSTSVGRASWITISGNLAHLQPYCGKEGFNVLNGNGGFRRARIGILGNDEDQCESCETVVGFGLQGSGGDLISCGGSGNLKSVCYIFVQ